ncbi:MAG: STAS-like domain-containing protein [Candidatus Cryptobacteroides sp.]
MEERTIKINEYISLNKGITSEEGEGIYNAILKALRDNVAVTLDFSDVEMTTTAFLNVVIGNLYSSYTSEELRERIKFKNVKEATALRVKKVTDNAKSYYSNPDKFSKEVEDVINGSN